MRTDLPLVSVVVTAYNREAFIAEALESILTQGYDPLEVIVIDDGSTDGTADVAITKFPQVRYHYQPNQGQRAALNAGVERCTADLITFLDSDDLWAPDALHKRVEFLQQYPEVDIVAGHVKNFADPSLDENQRSRINHLEKAMPGMLVSAMLNRRRVFDQVGLFGGNSQIASFMPWIMLAQERCNIAMLPDLVLLRRIHATNIGRTHSHLITQRAAILKEALDRRRGLAGGDAPEED